MKTDFSTHRNFNFAALRSARHTTRVERLLVFAMAVALPINEFMARVLPNFPLSAIQLLSILVLMYCGIFRRHSLLRIALHPVFLWSYLFVIVISFVEALHPNPSFRFIALTARMLIVAVALATLLRDRRAIRAFASGVLAAGAIFAISMLGQFDFLHSAGAAGFAGASAVRSQILSEVLVFDNLNAIGFWLLQATLIALVLATTARRRPRRIFFLILTALFFVCSFLPMSRSAVLIAFVTVAYYLVRVQRLSRRTVIAGAALGLAVALAVPPVVFQRMKFNPFAPELKTEGRATVYRAVILEFPRYFRLGVGEGNFRTSWGRQSLFVKGNGRLALPHNGPAAVLVFWGLPGLLALLPVLFALIRRVRALGMSVEGAMIRVFAISGLGLFMVVHNFYNKEFSFLIALPVAAHYWGVERARQREEFEGVADGPWPNKLPLLTRRYKAVHDLFQN